MKRTLSEMELEALLYRTLSAGEPGETEQSEEPQGSPVFQARMQGLFQQQSKKIRSTRRWWSSVAAVFAGCFLLTEAALLTSPAVRGAVGQTIRGWLRTEAAVQAEMVTPPIQLPGGYSLRETMVDGAATEYRYADTDGSAVVLRVQPSVHGAQPGLPSEAAILMEGDETVYLLEPAAEAGSESTVLWYAGGSCCTLTAAIAPDALQEMAYSISM